MQQAEATHQQLMTTGPLAVAAASGNGVIADILATHKTMQQLYHQSVRRHLKTYQQLGISPAGEQLYMCFLKPGNAATAGNCGQLAIEDCTPLMMRLHSGIRRLYLDCWRFNECNNTWFIRSCNCAGLCYCICCDLLGQQRELQPGDSITAKDLEALVQQTRAAVCKRDWPLYYLADASQHAADLLPGTCVLPDLLTALAVGLSNSAAGSQQEGGNAQAPSGLESMRETFSDLLLSCTAPEGLQQPPLKVLSMAELTPLIDG
jgi:hypothetical protein